MGVRATFARNLRGRKVVAGTFIKSNDPAAVEILALAGFDFAILDAEHSAFDRSDIARMAMAARAARLPLVVRIPEATVTWISTAIDAGCAGIMVPQVANAKAASQLVRMMRYGAGGLGFSPSTAGAEYGDRGIARHLEQQPHETVLICQVEDRTAVDETGDIAMVDGVDGILVGPVDLAVSIGAVDPVSPKVTDLCRTVVATGAGKNKAAGLFLMDPALSPEWKKAGATIFVLGSDQSFMLRSAKVALDAFKSE